MSDNITVNTSPPAPSSGYGGGMLFIPNTPTVTNQQVLMQMVMPYFSKPDFCVDYANFLVKYMNEHDLNDPLTMQVVLGPMGAKLQNATFTLRLIPVTVATRPGVPKAKRELWL